MIGKETHTGFVMYLNCATHVMMYWATSKFISLEHAKNRNVKILSSFDHDYQDNRNISSMKFDDIHNI